MAGERDGQRDRERHGTQGWNELIATAARAPPHERQHAFHRLVESRERESETRQSECCTCLPIILPYGSRYLRWRFYTLACVLYTAVVVPIRLSWNEPATGAALMLESIIDVTFLVDVGVSFNTSYQNEDGSWVKDRALIARNYLLGWFWIDAPSSVPVELIQLCRVQQDADTSGLSLLHVLRILRLARLMRLLRMNRLKELLEEELLVRMQFPQLLELSHLIPIFTLPPFTCADEHAIPSADRARARSPRPLALTGLRMASDGHVQV